MENKFLLSVQVKLLASFLSIVALSACSESNKSSVIRKTAPIELLSPQDISLEKIVGSITAIPLETNDSSLLRQFSPNSLWVGDDYILVVSDGLKQFDRTGKFIKQLVSKGEGPDNVPYIGDYWIVDDLVYVTYSTQCKVYNLLGQLVRSFTLPVFPSGFCVTENGQTFIAALAGIGANGTQRLAFFEEDKEPDIILRPGVTKEQVKNTYMLGQEGTFRASAKKIFLKEVLNDTIFSVDADTKTMHPFLILELGEKRSTPAKRYELLPEELFMTTPFNNFVGVNDKMLIFNSLCPDIEKQCTHSSVICYNLNDNTTLSGRLKYSNRLLDSIDPSLVANLNDENRNYFTPFTMTQDGKQLVSVVHPIEEKNPVLIFATFIE